jgi:DNA mismatch repair protein MutS
MYNQYKRIKRDHPGEVLFFRLGDFYEMFAEDALEVSALLNLTLTSRNGHPMCGIPYHASRTYIARLLKLGKKVAVCEQVSEPGKGLVERKVVEVITPGTALDDDYLDKGNANYLGALAAGRSVLSLACIDISSGDFRATSFLRENSGRLRQELEGLQIRELIVQESLLEEGGSIAQAVLERSGLVINRWADWLFDQERGRQRLCRQFKIPSLRPFGLDDASPEILAAGVLLDYLDDAAKSTLPHVRGLTVYQDSEYTGIDESTQRNLELVKNLREGDSRYSLLEVLDESRTAMGRRLLKWRILHPLRDPAAIRARLDMVETFYRDQGILGILRDLLNKTPDLERLTGRLAMDRAHGKDMLAVKNSLDSLDQVLSVIGELSLSFENPLIRDIDSRRDGFARLLELRDLLARALADDPSILLTEGNLIRDAYSAELDELRGFRDNGRQLLEEYLAEERQKTGIPGLKIRYNRIIGYYIEVSKIHLSRVPPHFIRRQGIAGGERFTTNRLSALESEINGAQDRIAELERTLFLKLREEAKGCLGDLSAAAVLLAELDAAQSMARSATVRRWVRPQVEEGASLRVLEGRHPVVEAHLPQGEFIPNDVILEEEAFSFVLLTGPNMAGKSTYLRMAALIVLMAQTGSFVPAREALVGIADRIYCRVGASDNLARGESTFLSEMNETAYILNTATDKSLVIMDEVGRGTGTKDGLSIAWAVSEDLLDRVKCRTLFATHYHELSLIAHPHLANRSMDVLDRDGEILFLRRIKEGPSAESYGLHVARLAGLSDTVLERAEFIMAQLRNRQFMGGNLPAPSAPAAPKIGAVFLRLAREIAALDLDNTTPLESLRMIQEWQKLLGQKCLEAPPEAADLSASDPAKKNRAPARSSCNSDSLPPKPAESPSLFDL